MYGLDDLSKEQLEESLKVIYSLEYLGVRIEDTKESDGAICYLFTVPEKSIIDIKDDEDDDTTTSKGLIKITKQSLIEMVLNMYKSLAENDPFMNEFIEEFKSYTSQYVKFYAKVRTGEIWTRKMGIERLREINNQVKEANEWKEV